MINFNENEVCGSTVCNSCGFPLIDGLCVNSTSCKAGFTYVLSGIIKAQQIPNSPLLIQTSKSVDLTKLNPRLLDKLELLWWKVTDAGYDIVITQGYRSIEEQNALFTNGKGVTKAKGGQSPHNYGLAFDIAVRINSKIDWFCIDIYDEIGLIGEQVGLVWGGRFKSMKGGDRPHYELKNWKSCK